MKPHEWRWAIRDSPLDRAAKTVAWALDSRMNGGGQCWPSKAQLAADTGYTTRTVDDAVNRLAVAGFVVVHRGGGRGNPNRYTLRNPAMNDKKPRNERHVNPATIAGEEVKKKKEDARAREGTLRPPLTAYAAAAEAIAVDAAMVAMARGWITAHRPASDGPRP